jgi:transcription elongation factor GreA
MQENEIVLSPAKYKELEAELERLQTVERRNIAERIKEARAMGDLSENFDYHDAKRQQGFLEGKIIGIKQTLERGRVADYVSGSETVTLGSVVKVLDTEFDEEIEYTIVGVLEADPATDKISNTSPVAQALMDHRTGETVQVQAPGGVTTLKILEVR